MGQETTTETQQQGPAHKTLRERLDKVVFSFPAVMDAEVREPQQPQPTTKDILKAFGIALTVPPVYSVARDAYEVVKALVGYGPKISVTSKK